MSTPESRLSPGDVPESVAPIVELMSTFPAPWALCGGWAVDAGLGRVTREHPDVDIAMFVQDHRALFDHLSDWQAVAHDPTFDGETSAPWDGRRLELPAHLHCRMDTGEPPPDGVLTPEQGFTLDILLDDRSGDDWVLNVEPRIALPIAAAVRESPWGLPTVVPEVLLFFKARELRRRDKLDFLALLPDLKREQRDWIRGAISLVGHPWLSQLSP